MVVELAAVVVAVVVNKAFGIVRSISLRQSSRSLGSRAARYASSAFLYSGVTLVGIRPLVYLLCLCEFFTHQV